MAAWRAAFLVRGCVAGLLLWRLLVEGCVAAVLARLVLECLAAVQAQPLLVEACLAVGLALRLLGCLAVALAEECVAVPVALVSECLAVSRLLVEESQAAPEPWRPCIASGAARRRLPPPSFLVRTPPKARDKETVADDTKEGL